jgi:hypothetical protein
LVDEGTLMAEGQNRSKFKPTLLHWLGVLLLVFGATVAANFLVRQVRESDVGHSYYEFTSGGVLIGVVGIAVMLLARHRSQPKNTDRGSAPDDGGANSSA